MITTRLESSTSAALTGAPGTFSANRPSPPQYSVGSMAITLEPNSGHVPGEHRRNSAQWCATCGNGFRMVTAFVAAAMADISFRALYRWAETEEIHFSATAEGALLVCLDSLLERANAQA